MDLKARSWVVFDAAAQVEGKSLNDFIHTGPDWLTSIIGVIMRFRQKQIAFAGDIAEMFNRVLIRDEDTFAQCFLWRDVQIYKPVRLYKMKAMLFGINSSPFLAQFVKNYNARQHKTEYPEAFEAIIRNHYVDDYLDSRDTPEEALKIIKDVIHVHKQGGFQIRSFICNNEDILKCIPKELVNEDFTVNVQCGSNYQKVLGLLWNAKTDTFQFNSFFSQISEDILTFKKVPTKREVLRVTMSIFDPLGFLSPVTIKARILMRKISEDAIGWDSKIKEDMFVLWRKWLTEVKDLESIKVMRCYRYLTSKLLKTELHIFNDASNQAYATAVYLRFVYEGDQIEVALVLAKARVAPKSLKKGKLTIPKLELMAAQLGAKMSSVVEQELTLPIDKKYFWSDSSTVLVWLRTDKKLPVFETNRVQSILSSSTIKDWNWLSTRVNVADLSTRDSSPNLTSNCVWFRGPEFLYKDESEWEDYTGKYNAEMNTVDFVMLVHKVPSSSFLPDVKRYSTYTRLINVTAWMKRFVENLKNKINNKELVYKRYPVFSELKWAEKIWIKTVQSESFPNDIEFAESGIKQPRRLIKHATFIDDGMLCINSRLVNSDVVSRRTKFPIILDGSHPFVNLLILKMHSEVNHVGFQTLVNNFRLIFWMPKMRLKIKSIIRRCPHCNNRDNVVIQPLMGNLPRTRFKAYTKPFTFCGMDYFGPFKIKYGRRLELRYGVLFTCLTTRAIHIEVAPNLTADSCILSIRRMKSRRGTIQELWSDNATNFKGAKTELLEAIREIHVDVMEKELIKYGIAWKNIPPSAPNFGGTWERILIGSFKRSIEAVFVSNRHPTEEVLQTTFYEAEYLLNSRPLYAVSDNPQDPVPITPNDFLIPGDKMEGEQGIFSRDEVSKKSWRTQQYLIQCFWKRFLKEYLPNLLLRTKWNESIPNIQVGRVVHLKDFDMKKGKWPLGIVEKTYPGEDGVVRVVDVRTDSKILKRPVNKLALCKF